MRLEISQEERIQMAQGIYQEASWLYSLVENILNLTRMEEGHLILNKQEALAEEIIEAACSTVEKRNKDRTIQVNIPSDIITVDVDEKLIVQLLVNLLENAIRHTPKKIKSRSFSKPILPKKKSALLSRMKARESAKKICHIFLSLFIHRAKIKKIERAASDLALRSVVRSPKRMMEN